MRDTRVAVLWVRVWCTAVPNGEEHLTLRRPGEMWGGEDFYNLKAAGFQKDEEVVFISKARYEALLALEIAR